MTFIISALDIRLDEFEMKLSFEEGGRNFSCQFVDKNNNAIGRYIMILFLIHVGKRSYY